MKTKRIVIYRDGASPADAIMLVNSICGQTIENPRPDLVGTFIATDVVSANIIQLSAGGTILGYGVCATIEVIPAAEQAEISTFLGISKEIMDAPFT